VVRTALDPFVKAGYRCAGPGTDQSAYEQWQCSSTASQGVSYSVIVDADDAGLKNVLATVDQSGQKEPSAAVAEDFFSQVTDVDFGGSTQMVQAWVHSHLAGGGQEQVGPVLVTLDSLQPVDHLNLFAQPGQ